MGSAASLRQACQRSDEWRTHQLRSGDTGSCECEEIKTKDMRLWSALLGAERHARLVARAADAEYRDCSCRGAGRGTESLADKLKPVGRSAARADA